MLPLCRFYRYLIYRMYHFRDDTPVTNVILTLSAVHLFQLLLVLVIIGLFTSYHFAMELPPYSERYKLIPEFLAWIAIHYLLFYDKKKWESFDEEFKDETPKQRKRGLIFVLTYLIGSIVLFFAILGYLIFTDTR